MTAFDRVERRLPELFDELAGAGIPDYFDDMLRSTTQARQRPAWSNPERWLPMGVIALPAPTRRLPLRYLALAGAVLLLLTAALVYVGSRRVAVPPPFGPARNGVIVYATADGDLAAWDPVTGTTKTIINGTDSVQYPAFSLDGTRLVFARKPTDPNVETDLLASADGSNLRNFITGPSIKWYDESGSGQRAIISRIVGATVVQSMVDMATGHETPLDVDPALGITMGIFRPGHDQVIYEHVPNDGVHGTTIYLAHGDGTGPLHQIPIAADAVNEAWPSPDGKTLVYSSWGTGSTDQGRIHVVDLDTGQDATLLFDGWAATPELGAQYSPDGKRLAMMRFGNDGFRITIVPADTNGPAVAVGPTQPSNTGGATIMWSPDGSTAARLLRHGPFGLVAAVERRRRAQARRHGLGARCHLAAPRAVGLLVGVRLGRIDRGGQVGAGHATRLLALRPVQLLVDLLLGVAALEQGLLGGEDHVRVAADVGDRIGRRQAELVEDRPEDRSRPGRSGPSSPHCAGRSRRDTVGTYVTG